MAFFIPNVCVVTGADGRRGLDEVAMTGESCKKDK